MNNKLTITFDGHEYYLKDSEWYDAKTNIATPKNMAQKIDRHVAGDPKHLEAKNNQIREEVIDKHKRFLKSHNKIYQGINDGSCYDPETTHCWSCKSTISTEHNYICNSCDCMICNYCGSCLCGYWAKQ